MLVKFISKERVIYANYNKILEYADKQVINPRDEDFIEAGYKPLEIIEQPEYDTETQYLIGYYIDTPTKVIQDYEIEEIKEGDNEKSVD